MSHLGQISQVNRMLTLLKYLATYNEITLQNTSTLYYKVQVVNWNFWTALWIKMHVKIVKQAKDKHSFFQHSYRTLL